MKAARIPREVYAYIENDWRRVISITLNEKNPQVVIDYDGSMKLYTAEESTKWDLLWPKGML